MNEKLVLDIITEDLYELKDKYAYKRRTVIADEADEFIRLCDAIAGFLRDSLEGDEDMQKLHRRAMTNRIIKKC